MYKFKLFNIGVLFFVIFAFSVVEAKNEYINEFGVRINEENYDILKEYMSDNKMETLSQGAYEEIMSGNVDSYQSVIVANTYHYLKDTNTYVLVDSKAYDDFETYSIATSSICNENSGLSLSCETEYKVMQLLINNSLGYRKFHFINRWKKMPKYKSFDVIGFRWTGDYKVNQYKGFQYNNGTTGDITYEEGNGNYKVFSNGIGLSQNLVDSATSIENELITWGKCTNGGTLYASYQHAQADITLATSKSYSLNANGMGSVFNFTGNAVGIYDDTPGIRTSYTC